VIGQASQIRIIPTTTYMIVDFDFFTFSSSPFPISIINPAYIIYITAIIDMKVRTYTSTSCIYSEKVLSVSISFNPCSIISIPFPRPHSPSSQYKTSGLPSLIKLSKNPADTFQKLANTIAKNIMSELSIFIEKELKFTFKKLYIN
jgi:hypothetical protein